MLSKYSFGNFKFYREQKALTKRFERTLTRLQTTFIPSPYAQRKLQEYKDVLTLRKLKDFSFRIHVPHSAMSGIPAKTFFVLGAISITVQNYWRYRTGERELKNLIEANLDYLDEVVDKGLEAYELTGTLASGWQMRLIN